VGTLLHTCRTPLYTPAVHPLYTVNPYTVRTPSPGRLNCTDPAVHPAVHPPWVTDCRQSVRTSVLICTPAWYTKALRPAVHCSVHSVHRQHSLRTPTAFPPYTDRCPHETSTNPWYSGWYRQMLVHYWLKGNNVACSPYLQPPELATLPSVVHSWYRTTSVQFGRP